MNYKDNLLVKQLLEQKALGERDNGDFFFTNNYIKSAQLDKKPKATILFDYSILSFSGSDKKQFLQNITTSDINLCDSNNSIFSSICTTKGKVLSTFFILNRGKDILLITKKNIAKEILNFFQKFILRMDVTINFLEQNTLLGFTGENLGIQFNFSKKNKETSLPTKIMNDGLMIKMDKRILAIIPNSNVLKFWQTICSDFKFVDNNSWNFYGYKYGYVEIDKFNSNLFLPQSINLIKNGAVSFKKGCYPGQEIVARSQYLGKIKKKLVLFKSKSEFLINDEIYAENKIVGIIIKDKVFFDNHFFSLAVIQTAFFNEELLINNQIKIDKLDPF